jgi:hypothetical protein
MTADDVRHLKGELLREIRETAQQLVAAAETEGAYKPQPRPDTRLAVGQSLVNGDHRLEIRVQRKSGAAWIKADKYRSKYPGEVNIAVVESVAVLPGSAVGAERAPKPSWLRLPLRLGSSVSHLHEPVSGSLGAFVLDTEDESVAILSCSHVLALSGQPQAKHGDSVIHPARGDIRDGVNDSNVIGTLSHFSVISRGGANAYDAASAKLSDGVKYTGNVIPDGARAPRGSVGKPLRFDPKARLGQDTLVAKVGRTSGYTTGYLNGFGIDNVPVQVPGIGIVYFDNCIEVRWKAVNQPFTRAGDSGALVFTADTLLALGIHFAVGPDAELANGKKVKFSYASDLVNILQPVQGLNLAWLDD